MGVPFGFSIGDLIAGIGIIKDCISALGDTSGAKPDYQLLRETLNSLSHAFEAIAQVKLDPEQDFQQHVAIEQAVTRCRGCIDSFIHNIMKYDSLKGSKQPEDWKTRLQSMRLKVQWGVLKRDDIRKFKEDLRGQVDAINLLLTTLQVYRDSDEAVLAQAHRTEARERHKTLIENNNRLEEKQESITQQNNSLLGLVALFKDGLNSQQKAMFELILSRQKESEERLFEAIKEIPAQVRLTIEIPPQVKLQLPVTFTDALGRVAPIHLDFINSKEAFMAILKVRFKHIGLMKVESNEFALIDPIKDQTLDLNRPWETIMHPGKKVNMSMIFRTRAYTTSCPRCLTENKTVEKGDTIWQVFFQHCKMEYQRVREVENEITSETEDIGDQRATSVVPSDQPEFAYKASIKPDEIADFQRVLLIAQTQKSFDPNCAICNRPAGDQCSCEAKALDAALRQAEAKFEVFHKARPPSEYNDVRTWVRGHSQDYILTYFSVLVTRRKDNHAAVVARITERAAYYYNARPHPGELAAADSEFKRGIDEDWRVSVQRYPKVLEYFYGLVVQDSDGRFYMPSDDDRRVRDPPLSSLI